MATALRGNSSWQAWRWEEMEFWGTSKSKDLRTLECGYRLTTCSPLSLWWRMRWTLECSWNTEATLSAFTIVTLIASGLCFTKPKHGLDWSSWIDAAENRWQNTKPQSNRAEFQTSTRSGLGTLHGSRWSMMKPSGEKKLWSLVCSSWPRFQDWMTLWMEMQRCPSQRADLRERWHLDHQECRQELHQDNTGPGSQTGLAEFMKLGNGKYLLNRTGYRLCEGFQAGECSQTTNGIWCSQAWDAVHQCDRCLGNHGSKSCPRKEMVVPGFAKSKGSGKGSGKGKKGGRRASYWLSEDDADQDVVQPSLKRQRTNSDASLHECMNRLIRLIRIWIMFRHPQLLSSVVKRAALYTWAQEEFEFCTSTVGPENPKTVWRRFAWPLAQGASVCGHWVWSEAGSTPSGLLEWTGRWTRWLRCLPS